MKEVEIYTDGACSGNPGPGGYGTILKYGVHEKELFGAYDNTTNNRMELMAIIKGLESLKEPCRVTVYSDSKYVVDAMTKGWVTKWQAKGWMRNDKERAKNVDLWQRLLQLAACHQLHWVWVKGHADNPYNNRCDRLAVNAIKSCPLLPDNPISSP
ncbi:ribonuclease HI [Desulfallas thermosapovorans]|uniref:Ribonuclease H n=1 Tax=Desulfallas thermosapovorans DSM 6562 TaxID=1121431 RepID=A0A5S4ZQ44_9FIRM|nr:ribonuclease HI [Desulfallas thermosapovorans]TYO94975.1 ribonuclease HI [Desulfallas thermosapovorans DSM 6562]